MLKKAMNTSFEHTLIYYVLIGSFAMSTIFRIIAIFTENHVGLEAQTGHFTGIFAGIYTLFTFYLMIMTRKKSSVFNEKQAVVFTGSYIFICFALLLLVGYFSPVGHSASVITTSIYYTFR